MSPRSMLLLSQIWFIRLQMAVLKRRAIRHLSRMLQRSQELRSLLIRVGDPTDEIDRDILQIERDLQRLHRGGMPFNRM